LHVDADACVRVRLLRQRPRLRAIICETYGQLKAGECHRRLGERDRDAIRLAGCESVGHAFDRELARSGVRRGVKVTGITGLLVEPAREARRSTVGIAVRSYRFQD
jgi:hypothetical protein